jgi:hypothetical protein
VQTSSRASAGDRSLRHTLQARPALGVPVVAVGLQHDPLDLLEGPPEALGRELLAVLVAEALAQPHLQGRLVDPVRPARNKTCSHTPGDLLRERGGIGVATEPGDPMLLSAVGAGGDAEAALEGRKAGLPWPVTPKTHGAPITERQYTVLRILTAAAPR